MSNSIASYGVIMGRQLDNKERWLAFAGLFIMGFTGAYNLFKCSSCLPVVGAAFGMDMGTMGFIMSVFNIAGAILAFPGAWLMRKVGAKSSLLVSAILALVGSLLGYFTDNAGLFLFSRVLEGCGYGMICVLGPNCVPRIFESKQQGLAMGIFSEWIPLGSVLSFFVAPMLFEAFGWHSLWIFSIVLDIIVIVWLLAFMKEPEVPENVLALKQQGGIAQSSSSKGSFVGFAVLSNVAVIGWVVVWVIATNQFYPTYLQAVKGWDAIGSSMPLMVASIICLPLGPLFGHLMNKQHASKWWMVIGFALVAVMLAFFAYTGPNDTMGPWIYALVLGGIVQSIVPPGLRVYIPTAAKDPAKIDYSLALMAFLTAFVQLFASFYGTSVEMLGWNDTCYFVLIPITIITLVCMILLKSDKKILEAQKIDDGKEPQVNS